MDSLDISASPNSYLGEVTRRGTHIVDAGWSHFLETDRQDRQDTRIRGYET